MIAVLPIPHQLKSSSQRQPGETRQRVFIRMLRGDVFSFLEAEFLRVQMHRLCTFTDQVHLDSAMGFVIRGAMAEGGEIEIRPQFPIGAGQNAEVEPRRDPFPVIVSRLQNSPLFLAVNADQQTPVAAAKRWRCCA